MRYHIDRKMFHVESLSPKQRSAKLEADLHAFADKYRRVIDAYAPASWPSASPTRGAPAG
ncbi:MAG: hypothetical protein ACOC7R_03210 [Planctomycetota bacterium]